MSLLPRWSPALALIVACASARSPGVAPPISATVRALRVEFCPPLGEALRKEVGASRPAMMAPEKVDGDQLLVTADYSGGCGPHDFKICATEFLEQGSQPQIPLRVIHRSEDKCDGAVRERMSIDLGPIKRNYERMYRRNAGAVLIELPNGELLYRFGN
jgi:hypothetical protein